jgi:APA family basic amino acid/polyamine antiporter
MFPVTGGQYVFLRESLGPMCAFLCGWTFFLVVMSGNIAFLAIGFATYLSSLWPMNAAESRAVAVSIIALFTIINYRGLRLGETVQNILTLSKLGGIIILVGAAFLSHSPSPLERVHDADLTPHEFALALAGALVAYEGWSNLSFVNGEIRNPMRNIPIALGVGVAASAAVYVLLTAAYLRVLPVAALASSVHVGRDVAARVLGRNGATFVTLIILISILGSTNGNVLAPPRLYFAQARDGMFFAQFAKVHPRFQTPSFSILMQGAWASILASTGSYELVATYAIFGAWFFYLLVVVGLILLRRRRPAYRRPYRMWGYPATPLLLVAVVGWFLISNLISNPVPSLGSVAVLASGIPVYWFWKRRPVASGSQVADALDPK